MESATVQLPADGGMDGGEDTKLALPGGAVELNA